MLLAGKNSLLSHKKRLSEVRQRVAMSMVVKFNKALYCTGLMNTQNFGVKNAGLFLRHASEAVMMLLAGTFHHFP